MLGRGFRGLGLRAQGLGLMLGWIGGVITGRGVRVAELGLGLGEDLGRAQIQQGAKVLGPHSGLRRVDEH